MRTPTEYEIDRLMHSLIPVVKKPKKAAIPPPPKPIASTTSTDARAEQRKTLAKLIQRLEQKLAKLNALIKEREQEAASVNHSAMAKKERKAKENTTAKAAAKQAEIDRNNKKIIDRNREPKTKLKVKVTKQPTVAELKVLATRVKGQIAIAKQKLAAL